MSNKYLLPCDCGKTVAIETSQAGQVVSCACGRQLTVPSLRAIRLLPAAQDSTAAKRKATWNPVKGAIFAVGAVLLLGGMITAGHSYLIYSQVVTITPSEEEFGASLETIGKMPADEMFESWHFIKEHPLEKAGSSPFAFARNMAREKLVTFYGGLIAAVIGLLLATIVPVFIRSK